MIVKEVLARVIFEQRSEEDQVANHAELGSDLGRRTRKYENPETGVCPVYMSVYVGKS